MRIGVAQNELSRNNVERVLAPGYSCVPRLRWLGKISASMTDEGVYLVRCLDDPGAIQAPLFPGALHDLNGGRTRFLVPAGPRSQSVLSGDPTSCT